MKKIVLMGLGLLALTGCHSNYTPTGVMPDPIHTVGGNPPRLPIDPNPIPTWTRVPAPFPTVCPAWGCNGPEPIATPLNGMADSGVGNTKDVDLQQAQVEEASLQNRAAAVSQQFQMSYESALRLTELADQVQTLNQENAMTAADRQAVANAALEIAGIRPDEVSTAILKGLKGDPNAVNDLLTKAALNLGMPSATPLRDQLLPALGVELNSN